MASSRALCQREGPGASSPAGRDSSPTRRLSWLSSSAASHCASNSLGNASMKSSDASMVSGLPGSSLLRTRSASSLTRAVRGAKPKSASKVVMSTWSTSVVHHACRRTCTSGRDCTASRKSCTRPTAAGTESRRPRTHSSRWISQRWRWARCACGSSEDSRPSRSLAVAARLNAAPDRSVARPQGRGLWPPEQKEGRPCERARRLPPRNGRCHAWCRWRCATGTRSCTERTRRA